MINVDKQNKLVCYNDEKHLYWNKEDNAKYISVTTLIGKFENEFDKEFWSAYKAIEKLISKEEFNLEKKQLLATKKVNLQYFYDMYEFTELQFNAAQQGILDEWAETNRQSCERGTKIHADLENQYLGKPICDLKKFGLGGKFTCKPNYFELDLDKGVYPEYLIYRESNDKQFRLAGQIDLFIKDGNDIYIYDYKTNKKLDDKSFFDTKTRKPQMMKYPLNNLMDCNKVHYTLQLSTYAWMLQKLNPEFNVKRLMLIHYDHQGHVTEHELDYLKTDVERMCQYYKRQMLLEESREKRKPIIF